MLSPYVPVEPSLFADRRLHPAGVHPLMLCRAMQVVPDKH